MAERASDRWLSISLSVLLHGALAAALIYGFWTYRKSRPPTPTLAIEATVVDPRSVNGADTIPQPAPPKPEPAPAPPPPEQAEPTEPTGPPEPTAEEVAQRQQAQKEQEQKDEEQKEQAQKEQAQKEEAEREAAAAQAAEQQHQEQTQAELKRQQRQAAQAKADAERKAEAEKKAEALRLAEAKQKETEQREAEDKSNAERQADLQRSLAEEEHAAALRSSGALASWESQIAARIKRAWLQPPTARPGIECVLNVTQAPGGNVVNVSIGACNGDQAVRESIEAAVYRASPLPPPPDPSLFQRDLQITFNPN
jgi:colicin import membrane protein